MTSKTGTRPGTDLSWAEVQFAGSPPAEHYVGGGLPPCELRLGDAPGSPVRACPDPAICRVVLYHLGDHEEAIPACAVHRDKAVDHTGGHGFAALCGGCRPGCHAYTFLLRVEPL